MFYGFCFKNNIWTNVFIVSICPLSTKDISLKLIHPFFKNSIRKLEENETYRLLQMYSTLCSQLGSSRKLSLWISRLKIRCDSQHIEFSCLSKTAAKAPKNLPASRVWCLNLKLQSRKERTQNWGSKMYKFQ